MRCTDDGLNVGVAVAAGVGEGVALVTGGGPPPPPGVWGSKFDPLVPDEHAAHTPERKKTIIARRTAHPLGSLKSVLLLSPQEDERNLPGKP